MRSVVSGPDQIEVEPDPRARRRAARRAASQTDILDAAERVFGEHGVHDGSVRQVAALSGFSTGAIYLFFDNKQHLVSETLVRRGDELITVLRAAAEGDGSALEKLHHIVDVTVAFFEERPDFRRLLRHITGGTSIVGPTLAGYGGDRNSGFMAAMTVIAGIVGVGQAAGEIRDGDTYAIAHLYSVVINEQVLLAAETASGTGTLTIGQFHALVDGMLRNPGRARVPPAKRSKLPSVGA
jgi:AcrR family transcriptional regulator